MGWTFGSPPFNGLAADCVEITVPDRWAPFVIAPPAAPVVDPAPTPLLSTGVPDSSANDVVSLDEIITHPTRVGSRIKLTLTGDAAQPQLQIRKSSKTLTFSNSLSLKN